MASNDHAAVLENATLRLEFQREGGGLLTIVNKFTSETVAVRGDAFAV